jgi:dolichol kinase
MAIKREACRKAIHFLGMGYIPLYLIVGKECTLLIVILLTLFAVFLEMFRRKHNVIPHWILHDYERNGVGAHFYFGVAIILITALLPMNACFAGIAVGSLGDGVAGLVKQSGRKNQASLAMLASSFLFLLLLSFNIEINFLASFIACLAGTTVEKFSRIGKYYLNDNLSVPIVSALFYHLTSGIRHSLV